MYIDCLLYMKGLAMNMSIVEARANLSDALNKVAYSGERIVLERHGKPAAAIVSVEDLELLEELENRSDLKAALKARKEKGMVPLAKVKARLGMK